MMRSSRRAQFVAPAILLLLASTRSIAFAQAEQDRQQSAHQEYFDSVGKMDAYQIPPTKALRGQRLIWVSSDSRTGEIAFGEDGRTRIYRADGATHDVTADVFEFAKELYFTAFTVDGDASGISIVADRRTGRLVELTSRRPAPGETTQRIQFTVSQAEIEGASEARLPPLETSEAMTGARFIETCADDIVYEHIYLNPHRVTWHAIISPEAGQADTEFYDAYDLRPGVHLVTWSEKVMAAHVSFLFDFEKEQTIGFIFGHDTESDEITADTFGCKLTILQPPDGEDETRP